MTSRILVVDDEKLTRMTLLVQLQDEGFEVATACNGYEALQLLEQQPFDLMLTDVRMPSMDGVELHREVRRRWPEVTVVLMTAYGTVANAVEALHEGVADYLTKPIHPRELLVRLHRLLELRREWAEVRRARAESAHHGRIGELVYRSPAMAAVVERALQVADTEVTVLIEGETGTGKEVLARTIHEHSARATGAFIAVNCSGFNPNLIESELFGHEAGAFTGALRQHRGRFECADGGTLLLDEIDDLAPEIQLRLLRFLQDHRFERVGGSKLLHSDVRVLCTTKQPAAELVKSGRLRPDLYYRINAVMIALPALRARREDVLPLAEHFARKYAALRGQGVPSDFSAEAVAALLAHPWPGNVRELQHAVEHAVAFARGGRIELRHLPAALSPAGTSEVCRLALDGIESVSFVEVLASCERQLIDWALARTAGNQAQAAERLQLSRTTLRSRIAALRAGREPEPPAPAEESEPGRPGPPVPTVLGSVPSGRQR